MYSVLQCAKFAYSFLPIKTPSFSYIDAKGGRKLSTIFAYSVIAKSACTTAKTFFSSDEVSLLPQSETSVELTGVIWKTPISAERILPTLLPEAEAICSARFFASAEAAPSISSFSSASLV